LLGTVYNTIGRYTESIDSLKQAVSIDHELLAAWALLGTVYYKVGQTGQVKEVYEILKKLDPSIADEFYKLFVIQ
jgi:tetratricopeptide (TPR) repeat protein